MKRPTQTTNIASGHNPGTYSHTSTSGPLIRGRVIIHDEDHKSPRNQQAGNKHTDYSANKTHYKTSNASAHTLHYEKCYQPKKSPVNQHPSPGNNQKSTKSHDSTRQPCCPNPLNGITGEQAYKPHGSFYKSHQRETDYTAGRLRP